MDSCHILRLPDELLVAVVELLPGDALKATRETCRKLNSVASPYLYPVLYLSCHQLDLNVFRLVANNPLLIGGVKELVIDDTTLSPRLANWEVYKTVASYPQNWPDRKMSYDWGKEFENEGRVWSEEPDKDFHALYKSVLRDHHANRRGHTDIAALKRALPLFKSLRSLVISNRTADDCEGIFEGAQSEESSSPVVKMWRRLGVSKQERPPFPPRCDWVTPWYENETEDRAEVMNLDWFRDRLDRLINKYGLPAAKGQVHLVDNRNGRYPGAAGNRMSFQRRHAESFDWSDLNYLEPGYYCRTIGREARGVSVALEVLGDPRIRITEFRVDASLQVADSIEEWEPLYQPGLSVMLFDSTRSPLVPKLTSCFSNLTKFHLVLSDCKAKEFDYDTDEGMHILDQGHVATILESMPQLEDLLLELHGMPIFFAMPFASFSRLRHVEFSCSEISSELLLNFLQCHYSTLQTLIIRYCNIDPDVSDETWEEVMEEVRDLQDEGILNFYQGLVIGVYDHGSWRGCGKNNTLTPEDTGCPIHSWEFIKCSLWKQFDGYPWDFGDDDWSYVGRGDWDTESEDGEGDKDGGDEGEQESSGI
ncbi:hypothetical protein FPANT_8810 [Fusarium pseudoanthophilum]|uniref:F-box domain-containing protein n=1 Tax=Fusarium pseudoanthophilum TaxID=48495 RepID=A0A8H5KYW1_9HYPO|nr:hypothetical protein FPANT_8810 [Fusarium pseudoanthophilum]